MVSMTDAVPSETDEVPSEEFIQGLKAGDEQAVAEFIDAYWAPGYRMALRMCAGDASAAEDVAQEAMLNALGGIGGFGPNRSFRPWFFRIVGNAARERLRRARRRTHYEHRARATASSAEPLDVSMSRQEDVEAVRLHLDKLPEHYRAAISLRFLEGLSLRQVAESLGCREGTVSSRIRRGLEALRRSLGPALATGLLLTALLPKVAQAAEVPPAPAARELLAARATHVAAAQGPSVLRRLLTPLAVVAALGVGVFLLYPLLSPGSGVQPPALVAGEAASSEPPPRGDTPAEAAGVAAQEPALEVAEPDLTPEPPAPAAVVPAIDGMVLNVKNGPDPAPILLSVGSDDRVQPGFRFQIHRGAQAVGTVIVVRVLQDSCACRVLSTAEGQAISFGDQATTRLD